MIIDERCEEKLNKWKVQAKDKITYNLNEKEYTFFRSTFKDNVYKFSQFIFPEGIDSITIDIDKQIFKQFITIVSKGNLHFLNTLDENKEKPKKKFFTEILEKKYREDQSFANAIRPLFVDEFFVEVVKDFGLNFISLGSCPKEDLIVSVKMETPYSSGNTDKYRTENVKTLNNPNNVTTGYFLNYNGNLEIQLAETIRTNKMWIKPFSGDTSNWSPTNGYTYTQVYLSADGKSFDYVVTLPSTYGSSTNNYITQIDFGGLYSFKYVKFSATSSGMFSLSYLTFVKEPTPIKQGQGNAVKK